MLANLRALFGGVVDIILFRRGPENLPASQALLAIVVAMSIVLSVAMSAVVALPISRVLLQSVAGSLLMLLWFRVALALANKRERFLQTMTAMFGLNTLLLPILMPLSGAMAPYMEKADPTDAPPAALMLVTAVVGVWGLLAEIRIVKAAFECPWVGAALLVFGEFLFAVVVFALLFGVPAKAA